MMKKRTVEHSQSQTEKSDASKRKSSYNNEDKNKSRSMVCSTIDMHYWLEAHLLDLQTAYNSTASVTLLQ